MPITKELSNIKKLEAVGFPHEQAEVLADIIEQSHVDSQQDLKEFIRNELKISMSEMKTSMSEMEARLRASQSDLLIKYSAIVAGFITMALAIAKLLW